MAEMGDPRSWAESTDPLQARFADALGAHDVAFADKMAFDAAMEAIPDEQREGLTWETLPQEVRDIIERCEAQPRTSWGDPMDVPDDTSYMD